MLELDRLVDAGQGGRRYGRFAARCDSVNPLDEYSGAARSLRRLRLKEWIGFTLLHPDLYSSMIIQDANFLASSEIYAYPRAAGALFQHAANAKGGSLGMPERLPGSHPVFAKPGYRLEYTFDEDGKSARVFGDIAATEKAPAFRLDLVLHADRASAPLSVSSRLPGGQEEESCIWTPSACEPLSDVTFTPSASSWHVASADGRLDLTFTPEGRKDVKVQLGIFALAYYQLFGSYSGTLRSLSGAAYPVDGVHGVCESFRARLLPTPWPRGWRGRPPRSASCATGRTARSRRGRRLRAVR